jgi:hypothetical protein
MEDQIQNTVSDITEKPLKDSENIFLVLGVQAQYSPSKKYPSGDLNHVFYPDVVNVLGRLSAKILAYLNSEHTRLLISCPLSKLNDILERKSYDTKYFQVVKRISPLLPHEQISEKLREDGDWVSNPKEVAIQLIPNLPDEKTKEYAETVINYIQQDPSSEVYSDADFIITNLKKENAETLLKASNFVFKLSEVPKGLLDRISVKRKQKKRGIISSKGSSFLSQRNRPSGLPIICILDSGINDVPQLSGYLVAKDGYRRFPNFDDDSEYPGHGTPIAHLAVFGEGTPTPKARVVSYKILSGLTDRMWLESYKLAIQRYSSTVNPNYSRIFLSSIGFKRYDDGYTAKIDRWVQENNVCAVLAAGNIDSDTVSDYKRRGVPCSTYIHDHPVCDPAQGVNILAVGAIAKKDASSSMSRRNELSPFTTCGNTNDCLYQCQKPEFVQHGGNICEGRTDLGVESIDKYGAPVNSLLGTSFSAPILAYRLAEIYGVCGTQFEYAETLKAIALALSRCEINGCMGFGEVKPLSDFNPSLQAIVCSEGTIPLSDSLSQEHFRTDYTAHISVDIPQHINSIKMCLVHSDNHFRNTAPHLNTYLKVTAHKTAHEYGSVDLINPNETDRKSNMKVFKWEFPVKSMEGTWTFTITPELTADMSAEHKKDTIIRYGCAILINSKSPARKNPLTEEIYELNRQKGVLS